MRYLRKFVQRVGLVSTLLIGGVLGGLLAPLPSEAASLSIDGVNIPLGTTVGTAEGNKYTCETGYNSCWFITPPGTGTRTIVGPTGTFKLENVSTTNRARVRINDLGGPPNTNVDKMNLTGIKLTPTTGGSKTIHIIITHTYTTGQGVGNYQWGMGATGYFSPINPDTVVNNKFKLTGKGKFRTPTSSDPEVEIGKLDKGPIPSPQPPGGNGIVTQTVNVKTVKTGCNSDSGGFCKPEITYDFEVTFVGTDSLVLTDSLIGGGIVCTDAQVDPLIPTALRFLMTLIDPSGNVPTHISDLYAWIDLMGQKYRLNQKQLAKLENLKIALAKWFASSTCPGKVQGLTLVDSGSGVNQGRAAGGILVTTCSDTHTCGTGTIVIKKMTSPATIENFGFTGTGEGITDFGIRTDDQNCSEGCSNTGTGSQTFSLLQTGGAGGPRTITETGLPNGWSTTNVSCTNSGGENSTYFSTYYGTASSAYVTVGNLEAGDTLTCTFENTLASAPGTFNGHEYRVVPLPGVLWSVARTDASSLPGGCWYLATITSPAEQTFINGLLGPAPSASGPVHQYWVGGYQLENAEESGFDWYWVNGEGPFVYTNWGPGEPNDANSPTPGAQQHLALDNRSGWAWDDNDTFLVDIVRGYVAERVSGGNSCL